VKDSDASPEKIKFQVVNMRSTTEALAVQINTIFGESNIFSLSPRNITKTRSATGNEIIGDFTDSRFLNNAFLRVILFAPRDNPTNKVVRRQAELIEWIDPVSFHKHAKQSDSGYEFELQPADDTVPARRVLARRSWVARRNTSRDGDISHTSSAGIVHVVATEHEAGQAAAAPAPSEDAPVHVGEAALADDPRPRHRSTKPASISTAETGDDTVLVDLEGLPSSSTEFEVLDLLTFMSDLEALCFKKSNLRNAVKRLGSTSREDFESTAKEVDSTVGRTAIRGILAKLEKEQTLFRDSKVRRFFKGVIGAVGCGAGGVLAAAGAVVSIPGFLLMMSGYAVQKDDFDELAGGNLHISGPRDGAGKAVGAIGAAGMAIPAVVGASGVALIEKSRSLFVPKVDDLVSKSYASSVRIVLRALGGDPDTVRPEVALLEEAVVKRFLELARQFRDVHGHDSRASNPILKCPNQNATEWLLRLAPCKHRKRKSHALTSIEECIEGWSTLENDWNRQPQNQGAAASTQLESYRTDARFSKSASKNLIYERLYVIFRFTELRKFINHNLILTFVGVHNAGKSEFIRRLWGFETSANILGRTETVDVFEADGAEMCARRGGASTIGRNRVRLAIVDTPGASDERAGIASLWSLFADVSSYFICVFKAGHVARPERSVVEKVENLGRPFIILINVHDRVIADDLVRDGSMDAARANYSRVLQVPVNRIIITNAMDDAELEQVRKRIWHMLAPLISSGDPQSCQDARRQLALSLCHANVMCDLQLGLCDAERCKSIANVAVSILSSPRATLSASNLFEQLESWQKRYAELELMKSGSGTQRIKHRQLGLHLALPLYRMGYRPCVLEAVTEVAMKRVHIWREQWIIEHLSLLDAEQMGSQPIAIEPPVSILQEALKTQLLEQFHILEKLLQEFDESPAPPAQDATPLHLIRDNVHAICDVSRAVASVLDMSGDEDSICCAITAQYIQNDGVLLADEAVHAALSTSPGRSSLHGFDAGSRLGELFSLVEELRVRSIDTTHLLGISSSPTSELTLLDVCPPDNDFEVAPLVGPPSDFTVDEHHLDCTLTVHLSPCKAGKAMTHTMYAEAFLDHLGHADTSIKDLLHFVLAQEEILFVEFVDAPANHEKGGGKRVPLLQVLDAVAAVLQASPRKFGFRNTNEDPHDGPPRPALLFPAHPSICGINTRDLQKQFLTIGRLVGMVILRPELKFAVSFAPAFYKILLGRRLGFEDVEIMDKATARSILEHASLFARELRSDGRNGALSPKGREVNMLYTYEVDQVMSNLAHESVVSLSAGVENIVDQATLNDHGLHVLQHHVEFFSGLTDELSSYLFHLGPNMEFLDETQHEHWTRTIIEIYTRKRMATLLLHWTGRSHIPLDGVHTMYPPLRVFQVRGGISSVLVHFYSLENILLLQAFESSDDMLDALCSAIGVTSDASQSDITASPSYDTLALDGPTGMSSA